MTAIEYIDIDRITINDGFNARYTFQSIEPLSRSIETNGLLQNIVVRPSRGTEDPNKVYLVAGERRVRAIRILVKAGKWKGGIPALIYEQNGATYAMLAENQARESIPLWRIGYKYLELMEAGATHADICARLGCHNNHVSICSQIARGLHPDIVKRLDRIPKQLNRNQLLKLCKLLLDTFEPDLKAQNALVTKFLGERERKKPCARDNIPEKERVITRYKKLKRGEIVPAHAMPYVNAIIRYLNGEDARLTFPEPIIYD